MCIAINKKGHAKMKGEQECKDGAQHIIRLKVNAPMVLFLVTRRFADSTELKKNIHIRYTANANALIKNGEKSNAEVMKLYKGVVPSPGMNADFVMKAGIHKTSAIMTMTRCCAR